MRYRATGKDRLSHNYAGFEYPTQEEFLKWAREVKNMSNFYRLWIAWRESGYTVRLSPSIDRIDNTRGYPLDNIQWLSFGSNSSKGRADAYNLVKDRPKEVCTLDGCNNNAVCRTYCDKHYTRWKRHKNPNADFTYLRGFGTHGH